MFLGGIVFFLSMATAALPVQMGEFWDREVLKKVSDIQIKDAALSVGRIKVTLSQSAGQIEYEVGTAFVVGVRGDDLIMATNHHVFPSSLPCTVSFTTLGRSAGCKSFLGSWKDIELTLFTVDAENKKFKSLKENVLELDGTPLTKGTKLFTMGYGYYKNLMSRLTVEQSYYCRAFSEDTRFVPAGQGYGAFSFAHGCEISTGDSGSPIFNEAGKVVGIQWAATVREKNNVISESTLENLLNSLQPTVWNSLSYAVPAQYIIEKLNQI